MRIAPLEMAGTAVKSEVKSEANGPENHQNSQNSGRGGRGGGPGGRGGRGGGGRPSRFQHPNAGRGRPDVSRHLLEYDYIDY